MPITFLLFCLGLGGGGFISAVDGMLCQILYWKGTQQKYISFCVKSQFGEQMINGKFFIMWLLSSDLRKNQIHDYFTDGKIVAFCKKLMQDSTYVIK